MKKIIISGLLLFIFASSGFCGQSSRIELSDGSVINGEVESYANGVYTIKSPVVGEMQVDGLKVTKIEAVKPVISQTAVTPVIPIEEISAEKIQSYGKSVASNPENAAAISKLASNPKLQDLAHDPDIAKAAKSGDIQSLLNNKKFVDIVNDPSIQETVKKLKK